MLRILILSSSVLVFEMAVTATYLNGAESSITPGGIVRKQSHRRAAGVITLQSQIDHELLRLEALTTDAGPTRGSRIPKLIPSRDGWMTGRETLRRGMVSDLCFIYRSSQIYMGRNVYRSKNTSVYVLRDERYVIKYHRFCTGIESEPVDTMVVDWFFLKDLYRTVNPPITPKPLYLSAPVEQDRNWPPFGKLPYMAKKCGDGSFPKLRFMVSERTGINVADYFKNKGGRLDIVTAVKMGVQMIRLLQQLHETKNYIHGDVRWGSFVVSLKEPKQLLLISFGRARIVDRYRFPFGEDTFNNNDSPLFQCDLFASQWESRGRLASFRDDVYRALTLIADSIHGDDLYDAVDGCCQAIEHYGSRGIKGENKITYWQHHYLKLREELNFFDAPSVVKFDPDQSEQPQFIDLSLHSRLKGTTLQEYSTSISDSFAEALKVVRRTPIAQMPQYTQIIDALLDIIRLGPGEDQVNPSTLINFNA